MFIVCSRIGGLSDVFGTTVTECDHNDRGVRDGKVCWGQQRGSVSGFIRVGCYFVNLAGDLNAK
jgi:hypothetical protein